MAVQTPTATGTAPTVNAWFMERAARHPEGVALRRKIHGGWESISWRGYRDLARRIGLGLVRLGLERGQAAAILSETRVEWAAADLGILGVGGITVPIYQSNLPPEVLYILKDSQARFLLCEDVRQWAKVRGILDALPGLERVILIDGADRPEWKEKVADHPFQGHPKVMMLEELMKLGAEEKPERFDELARGVGLEDVATFIYTSGTTGEPKGVILTHGNASAECEALADMLEVDEDDTTLAFLPLAHVFARVLHWMQLRAGYQVAFAESTTKVVDNMSEVQPTFFAAVPRVYEKIHARVAGGLAEQKGFKRAYATWALATAMRIEEMASRGQAPGLGLALKRKLGGPALKGISGKLRLRVGPNLKWFISGGAPLSREIAGFFRALGLTIYEGYGLTETTAATHVNTPSAYKLGTVGRAVCGVETRIAQDGEILVRGPVVMRGYHGREKDTAEAIQDGWFHTGDIGEVDAEGFLRITDRKKDLLITAAGKNIAPQAVENHLKTAGLISQACLFGDKKQFCVALLTIDEEAARKALDAAGIVPPTTYAELSKHPRVREMLDQQVAEKNRDLPSYETVKYFDVLEQDFEVGDELTPSLKVKRKRVLEKYGALVEALYARADRRGD